MTTKMAIKQQALNLFNKHGLMNVTLRHVAEALNKSYGNITYHYHTKEDLLHELYNEMIDELKQIGASLQISEDMLLNTLNAPAKTFDLSIKYLFFYKDFVELRRNYPTLAKTIEANNAARKKHHSQSLMSMQHQKILRTDLDKTDIDYLMELSGIVRTFFFINLTNEELKSKTLKTRYVEQSNRLLLPYLSAEGLKQCRALNKSN